MNVKYNVLYPREYRLREDGPIQTQWIQCGVAWQTERGVDIKLWVVPPASLDPLSGMAVRLKLREPRGDETDASAAPGTPSPERSTHAGAHGSGAAPDGPPRRPEHRDQLEAQGQLRGVPTGRRGRE